MDHLAFFNAFTQCLGNIVQDNPRISKPSREGLERLRKNIGDMWPFGVILLDRILHEAQLEMTRCQYHIDGRTFCRDLPESVCTCLHGTPNSQCDITDDWSTIAFTAPVV